ncbi:MAG: hypothetical protein EOP82_18920 [Variovorax sp.]|nr:MAG: hypothetical protein EOP82_18920 [Variovorax sp.]
MAKKKRRTRQALAGLCLAALSAIPGAAQIAAEAERASVDRAQVVEQSAGADAQGDESDPASFGGAIYSPFSTAFQAAAAKPGAYATPTRQPDDEGTLGVVSATLGTFVAFGLFLALVRLVIAS